MSALRSALHYQRLELDSLAKRIDESGSVKRVLAVLALAFCVGLASQHESSPLKHKSYENCCNREPHAPVEHLNID